MKHSALIVCLLLAILAAGCLPRGPMVTGSGRMVERELEVGEFSRIEASHAFELEIVQGSNQSVTITADDNLFDDLDTSVAGDTLRLRLRPGSAYRRTTLRARITMPSLRALQLSGASRASLSGFRSQEDLALELSGASTVRGELEADEIRIGQSGASRVELSGSGSNLRLQASGASDARLAALAVRDVDVSLSGASTAELNVSGRLDANLSGASRLEYTGNPTLGRTETSGGSSIRAR